MSVGGMVIAVALESDQVWINTREIERWKTPPGQFPPVLGEQCAIYVERDGNSVDVHVGDTVWWQGRTAFWTPHEPERRNGKSEIKLIRRGYSHAPPKPKAIGGESDE